MITLNFIEHKILHSLCKNIIDKLENITKKDNKDIYKNIIDPFSAIFDASFHKISLTEWLQKEKIRQIQKSLQNEIRIFHQSLLGNIKGWKSLATGSIVDLVSEQNKIVAEIKNKFNTTKGNHKISIYDDLESIINSQYEGYTGYYVTILTKKRFNNLFTPPDNKTKTRRTENTNIREIDGASFYEIVTGQKDAIKQIYCAIPFILSDILNNDCNKITQDPLFEELFQKAFK